jgi:hypothetical protein
MLLPNRPSVFPQKSSPQWLSVAQRLASVRQACLGFLDQWADSRLSSGASGIDRIAADISRERAEIAGFEPEMLDSGNDNENRDWSVLYRGSVLDD